MPQSSQSRYYPPADASTIPYVPKPGEPRFLDQVANAYRLRHLAYRTEQTYVGWGKRFVLLHNKRHACEMGASEVRAFLAHLACSRRVAASSQNQALDAIVFMCREAVHRDPGEFGEFQKAKRPKRLPTVLTRDKVSSAGSRLQDRYKPSLASPARSRPAMVIQSVL